MKVLVALFLAAIQCVAMAASQGDDFIGGATIAEGKQDGKSEPPAKTKYNAVFSICQAVVPISNGDFPEANKLTPTAAWPYYFHFRGRTIQPGGPYLNSPLQITLFEAPRHGELDRPGSYIYRPNKSHLGVDEMVFLLSGKDPVDGKETMIKVIYSVHTADRPPEYGPKECPDGFGIQELNM